MSDVICIEMVVSTSCGLPFLFSSGPYRFEDEFVVVGEVEDGTRGPGVAQLTHRLVAEAHLENKFFDLIHSIHTVNISFLENLSKHLTSHNLKKSQIS